MFTSDEDELIIRFSVRGGWDATEIVGIKKKIRDHFINNPSACCCYCRRAMHQWDRLDIDTEHVLPKGSFPQWTFKLVNLNISCKRCNMRLKNEDYSFFKGQIGERDPFKSELYSFLHPNLDDPHTSLVPVVVQIGAGLLIKYYVAEGCDKAKVTYEYFRLNEVEVDSLDSAQGLDLQRLSESLPASLVAVVEALLGENARI